MKKESKTTLAVISKIAKSLWKHKYVSTLVVFVVVVGFLDPNSFLRRYELHSQNEELKDEIVKYRNKYKHDSIELHQLQTNPSAVEQVARVHHFMKTDDEDIYIMEGN